ncbi:glycosyltransferase family 2 protein [Rhodanobacter sp. DHB23]|uniref:glycosyltransferase family 2 protein n=1 Tax=Rhodanobacter sp. DHB23 TaxID=2775923 RepID=UPI00177D6A56|nr:glycosyltransferase family 2 protein [Rhodanobacter sp. DHB23]MBD8874623.1 glycosyltransferase family 2 protein [Rhodanobacter sp. DHB23]
MDHDILQQVTLVCVTYQSHGLVDELADMLRLFPKVLVIDNGSSDGTAGALRERLPQARIIERAGNAGFGCANNEAMAQVATPYALLLNPDCRIEPATLLTLLDTLRRYPDAAIAAPQGWRDSHTPRKSYRPAFYEMVAKMPYRVPDATCSVRWVPGCCLLLRVEVFKEVGGFDERFFLYYEDDDLCLRLHDAGYECLLEPAAKVLHPGNASSAPSLRTSFTKHYHYARSRHMAIRKYLGAHAARRHVAKLQMAAPFATAAYALLLQRKHCIKWLAWSCAVYASIFNHPL